MRPNQQQHLAVLHHTQSENNSFSVGYLKALLVAGKETKVQSH